MHESELSHPSVRTATEVKGVPARPARVARQILCKLGGSGYERDVAGPLIAARRAVLGERAAAPPRLLVRVDEFPHYRAWDDPRRFGTHAFERFHEIMRGAGVPYLVAALARISRDPLSPQDRGSRPLDQGEREMLAELAADGVQLALHGYDHRTRWRSPRRHSELCGLSPAATEELLERALGELRPSGFRPRVFVPPYNRFDARQLPVLASRFELVCGGPESIGLMGLQRTPQWRGRAVYLPSYAPFYGRAPDVLPAVQRAIEGAWGLWVPVVLHWGWEAERGWRELERLAQRMAGCAVAWEDFFAAIGRSRVAHA